jgi:hypothetical protein
MYRGSSFLLGRSYTVHRGVVDVIAKPRFNSLWNAEFGARKTDIRLIPPMLEAIDGIRRAYKPFAPTTGSAQPTDTLISKVVLGTFGCLPAGDEYFIRGFRREGLKYSYLNDEFIERVHVICQENLADLHREQVNIHKISGMRYPLMKLVDMYFWQIGRKKTRRSQA